MARAGDALTGVPLPEPHCRIQGDVHCVALVLGENAQLEGSVVAEQVMVRGRLIGSIRALTVTLEATSYVEGNVFHKSLSIEQGKHFEGESRPSEDPLSSSPEVPTAESQLIGNGLFDAAEPARIGKGLYQITPGVAQCLDSSCIGGNHVCVKATRNSDRQGIEDSGVPSENLIRWVRSRKENRIMIGTDGDLLQTSARIYVGLLSFA